MAHPDELALCPPGLLPHLAASAVKAHGTPSCPCRAPSVTWDAVLGHFKGTPGPQALLCTAPRGPCHRRVDLPAWNF